MPRKMPSQRANSAERRTSTEIGEANIRDIFALSASGEIDEEEANTRLEEARRSRHNLFERGMAFLIE